MPRFAFEQTCTSRPLYEVDADTLAEAIAKFQSGKADLREEPVEENYLIDVSCDGYSVICEAEQLGLAISCPECSSGAFASGVPGILARMENGRLAPGAGVQRCDYCQRFESDEAALEHLGERGLA